MKKLFTSVTIFLCLTTGLRAMNLQRLYKGSDLAYKETMALCTLSGCSGPSSATPVTAAQLVTALEHINPDTLSAYEKDIYEKLQKELHQANSTDLHLSLAYGVNTVFPKAIRWYESVYPQKDRPSLLDGSFNADMGDNLVLNGNFVVKAPIQDSTDKKKLIDANWTFLFSGEEQQELYTPYQAGISLGNNNVNFQLGRNHLSEGDGITGNLALSDNFTHRDYAKLTCLNDRMLYNLTVIQYNVQTGSLNFNAYANDGKKQYYVSHRLETNVLDNLQIILGQSSMVYADTLALMELEPMIYPHNFYNFSEKEYLDEEIDSAHSDEANNLVSGAIRYTFAPRYSLYAQLLLDQVQLPWESTDRFPNASGLLCNVKHVEQQDGALVTTGIEMVYTMPYLYLNRKYNTADDDSESNLNYNYDFIVGYRGTDGDEIGYNGYPYGPDCFVLAFSKDMLQEKREIHSSLTYILKGPLGIKYNNAITDYIPTDFSKSFLLVGPLSHELIYNTTTQIAISKQFNINGGVAIVGTCNKDFDNSNSLDTNIQGYLVAKLTIPD